MLGDVIYHGPPTLSFTIHFKPEGRASCRNGTCIVPGELNEKFESMGVIRKLIERGVLIRCLDNETSISESPVPRARAPRKKAARPIKPAPTTRPPARAVSRKVK